MSFLTTTLMCCSSTQRFAPSRCHIAARAPGLSWTPISRGNFNIWCFSRMERVGGVNHFLSASFTPGYAEKKPLCRSLWQSIRAKWKAMVELPASSRAGSMAHPQRKCRALSDRGPITWSGHLEPGQVFPCPSGGFKVRAGRDFDHFKVAGSQ